MSTDGMTGRPVVILRIARGRPGALGAWTDHEVPVEPGMTILDALEAIRSGKLAGRGSGASAPLAPAELRYRHSCHHGSCGTCGALVDGEEKLMCLARLEDYAGDTERPEESLDGPPRPAVVTLEPLRRMDVTGDLAVDPGHLFAELPEGAAYLRRSDLAHGGPRDEDPASPYVRFESCIECGICVSACPASRAIGGARDPGGFAGPAALAMADRDREERPGRLAASLAFAAGPRGVAACEKAFACSRACPQGVAPGRRIAALRKALEA